MRQIFLDTETTGLEVEQGHRIIEIACVEMIDRKLTGRRFHYYINPGRDVEEGAFEIHGISNEFLADKPRFSQIVDEFLEFVKDATLVIHNAPFDEGFINKELESAGLGCIASICQITDTLKMAREMHPGQKNSLDALCRRYEVDNSHRELHGALLDAEILADVYLRMTGGQVGLALSADVPSTGTVVRQENVGLGSIRRLPAGRSPLPVIAASDDEAVAHASKLERIQKASGQNCLWLRPGQS